MSARILIVEDNPTNLQLMRYLLEAFGHTTLSATSGEQGLEMALREKPDLIISDINLPGMNGSEFVQRLREEPAWSAVPTVAVTSLAMVGDRERILRSGFDGYISKPIDPETFVREIESFLAAPGN